MTEFHETVRGARFFDGTMPRIAEALQSIAASLEKPQQKEPTPTDVSFLIRLTNDRGEEYAYLVDVNVDYTDLVKYTDDLVAVLKSRTGEAWNYADLIHVMVADGVVTRVHPMMEVCVNV